MCVKELENTSLACGSNRDLVSSENPTPSPAADPDLFNEQAILREFLDTIDKDKKALFNVAYNVTDNISSRAILQHNNYIFNRYLPVFIFLAQPFYASVSKGAASTIFYTFGMVQPRDSNPRRMLYQLSYRGGSDDDVSSVYIVCSN